MVVNKIEYSSYIKSSMILKWKIWEVDWRIKDAFSQKKKTLINEGFFFSVRVWVKKDGSR